MYEIFLINWTRSEPIWDAVSRNIETLTEWSEETNNNLNEYFTKASDAKIISEIVKAKITGWILFGSDTGVNWLDTLLPEQLQSIYKWIDPEIWNRKMDANPEFESVKSMLNELHL